MKNIKYSDPIIVTVDVVLFTIENDQLKVLVINRANDPFKGAPALPGGFVHKDETTEQTAHRILKDKAGIENMYIEQLYTFDAPGRDPRGQVFSVTYFALARRESIAIKPAATSQEPHFVPLKKLPKLAFDHATIIAYATERLQTKLEYTNVIYSLLPRLFTMSQLQQAYETILDQKLDKRNFQKKYLQLGLIILTKNKVTGGRQRPARLYEFKSKKLTKLKKSI